MGLTNESERGRPGVVAATAEPRRRRVILACMGDANDPAVWSGTAFHVD